MKAGDIGMAAVPGRQNDFKEALETSIKYCKALTCPRLVLMSTEQAVAI